MAFKKQGISPIAGVYCSCGGEIKDGKCTKCGKEVLKETKEGKKKANTNAT